MSCIPFAHELHRKRSVSLSARIGCVQQKKQLNNRFALIGLYF